MLSEKEKGGKDLHTVLITPSSILKNETNLLKSRAASKSHF